MKIFMIQKILIFLDNYFINKEIHIPSLFGYLEALDIL
jgi:hypothetical protein